jgi:hypothetical protein
MYTRRSFLSKFILGTLGIVSGLALTTPKAQATRLSTGRIENTRQPEATITLDDMKVLSDGRKQNIIYSFAKGPDFTTLEDAYEEMLANTGVESTEEIIAGNKRQVILCNVTFSCKRLEKLGKGLDK